MKLPMKKTVAFSKHATNLFFHILTQCNLKCRHCYINKAQHGADMLPVETIETWLRALAPKSGTANVIFLGGEPTLHPGLPRAVQQARAIGYSSVTVDTNGYLFHDILAKTRPDEVDYFSFSLDGATRETNDRIRGQGTYDKCLDGIRQAVKAGFNASLIYTVSRMNIQELALMPSVLQGLAIDRFFIQVIGIRGRPTQGVSERLQVSRAEWIQTVPDAAAKIARLGIRVTFPKVFLNLDEAFECAGVVAENYFIFPNGRVYRCPLCEDFPLHSLAFENDRLQPTPPINEQNLFALRIAEGCVMNKLIQPGNLEYDSSGRPRFQVACCMLKEEISYG